MNETLINLLPEFNNIEFIFGLIAQIILTIILAICYNKFGKSYDNRQYFSILLPIFGMGVFTLIIVIKNSIALSLGLVGALSIIRFRTAIKDVEQTIVFLITMAVALTQASGFYLAGVISVLVYIFYIFIIHIKFGDNDITMYSSSKKIIKISKVNYDKYFDIFSTFQHEIYTMNTEISNSMNMEIKINSQDVRKIILLFPSGVEYEIY